MSRRVSTYVCFCLVVAALAIFSVGCNDSGDGGVDLSSLEGAGFLVTVNAGTETGSLSLFTDDKSYTDVAVFNTTDLGVTVYDNSIFVLGKYNADWLARFELSDCSEPVYQYSTVAEGESSMNPRVVVIANNNTGYVFRYQSSASWIIDPSPENEDGFKVGELDLSAYNSGDNVPNPVDALIAGNKLYVLLERNNGYMYDVNALLVAFDISNPRSPVESDSLELIVRSPNSMQKNGNNIYVAGWGVVALFEEGTQTPSGGIEKVDCSGSALSSELLVDDGDNSYGSDYTYGAAVTDVAVVSASSGYIYFSEWFTGVYKVLPFTPATGTVDTDTVLLEGINLSDIIPGPDGNVRAAASWGLEENAGVYTIDTDTNTVTGPRSAGLQPVDMDFNE